ncbi:acyl--CoA ligase [Methylobacterium nodulans]|uniref:AMP-dependent synthetase and ligase n=1 Tax=Methylobacterium nodulans (strain LMG 21967 / CNCM I-2342 / ORS 2060) TaxID=460265 RepID=B8IU55_METNO|nr:acyl--CoA ligase [Methylobacterium nodulans]ACL55100.1 AMP-dependent synthetase and ligase [Methylobacterium nodulans ORS 2060]
MAEDAGRTIEALMRAGAEGATALDAPGGTPLSFGALRALMRRIVQDLNAHGVGRGDRVAIVLDNGPAMAAAFIAIAAGATSAPLNPTYRAEEFEFYLTDLKARVLVTAEGSTSPAIAVAEKLGVPVVRLRETPEHGAGSFTLRFPAPAAPAAQGGPAEPGDVALVLHTSGTTSRPKIVPLTQCNVCASARNIRTALAFGPQDRGLNIMPLFHIHGLIAGILAPLSAGGSVACTPGFNALKFFAWMDEVGPTWYTAVPTMHQAILARAGRNREIIARHPLRFLRSSSSSMPPQVLRELEAVFDAPLIEAYGMTEAAHQMASNPLPPRARKAGSVGLAAGPDIQVVDEAGNPLPAGETGEIVIRGDNVMAGYENNPKANAEAFTPQGYFRTGDQGVMDEEGYLAITGRLKEIINRGGEKISPREVDEILMDHPSVAQVVTFAVPHDKLGEEVGAAVVLRDGQHVDDKELRAFVAERAAAFKVPSRIMILDEIPKGATGKLQRIGLARKLGLA